MIALYEEWLNGNCTDVVAQLMSYNNSHIAVLEFYELLGEKKKFLNLVEQYESDSYYGGKERS